MNDEEKKDFLKNFLEENEELLSNLSRTEKGLFISSSEKIHSLLLDAEKAQYVFTGLISEITAYAQSKNNKDLERIINFHFDRWLNYRNIDLPK